MFRVVADLLSLEAIAGVVYRSFSAVHGANKAFALASC
jgi:hypothetical protein